MMRLRLAVSSRRGGNVYIREGGRERKRERERERERERDVGEGVGWVLSGRRLFAGHRGGSLNCEITRRHVKMRALFITSV